MLKGCNKNMSKKYVILGVQYGGHDTSAALMIESEIVAACEQERFDLVKHSRAFPHEAIKECLKIGEISFEDISEITVGADYVDMIRKVYLKPALEDIERIEFLIKDIDRIKSFYKMEQIIRKKLSFAGSVKFFRHHKCHLASAYYPSGFSNALLVSYDGMGEIETGMLGRGVEGKIECLYDSVLYPHSLGLFYSAVTYYLGWKHHCDEGIIMGLASFGDYNAKVPNQDSTYLEVFEEIIRETGAFSYEIDLSWIAYHQKRDTWISDRFKEVFGQKRDDGEPVQDHHKNIAAALQKRIEDIVLKQLRWARQQYGYNRLCISGGVGLNCTLNGKIAASGIFDEIFVQPASGDAGIAIGSVFLAEASRQQGKFKPQKNHNFYLGSRSSEKEIETILKDSGQIYEKPDNLFVKISEYLAEGMIIGWFQGRAEFGPRALGNRSILCRPYPEAQKDYINSRVKFREEFRPFAPAVLSEHADEYFEINQESPHMLIACQVKMSKKEEIPAVVHVNNSCRVQTVRQSNNNKFYSLLKEFQKITDCPVLLNTSFNVKGQPIVNTPKQAIECYLSTNIDVLVLEDYMLCKKTETK